MCLGVFLASAVELPAVPWSPAAPAFNVAPISEYEEPVRQQFSRPHVYYLGSHTQCGCGFSPDERGDPADRRRALEALAAYVGAACERGPAELFVCWEGDYAAEPGRRLRLGARDLARRDDWLAELSFVGVAGPAS
jgi:hypothetical protein